MKKISIVSYKISKTTTKSGSTIHILCENNNGQKEEYHYNSLNGIITDNKLNIVTDEDINFQINLYIKKYIDLDELNEDIDRNI